MSQALPLLVALPLVAAAILADIPRNRILNFLPVEELHDWVSESRARSTR